MVERRFGTCLTLPRLEMESETLSKGHLNFQFRKFGNDSCHEVRRRRLDASDAATMSKAPIEAGSGTAVPPANGLAEASPPLVGKAAPCAGKLLSMMK